MRTRSVLIVLPLGAALAAWACTSDDSTIGDGGADASKDAAKDAGGDGPPFGDGGPPDSSVPLCGEVDASAFQPTQLPATEPFGQNRCNQAQIVDYMTKCTWGTSAASCAASFDGGAADLDCFDCLLGDAGKQGPVLGGSCPEYQIVNKAGCLLNATGDSTCTNAWLAEQDCAHLACSTCTCAMLPQPDTLDPCIQDGGNSTCSSWAGAASCVNAYTADASSAAHLCVAPIQNIAQLALIAGLFCGPTDAGAD